MKRKNGFTLIELLVVLAIIAIVASLIITAIGKLSGGDDIVGKITLKQTQTEYDFDDDPYTVYYVEIQTEDGNKETYSTTRSLYNKVHKGSWHKVRVKNHDFMNQVYDDVITPPTPPEDVGNVEPSTGEIDY